LWPADLPWSSYVIDLSISFAPWSSPFRRRRPNATWLDVGRAVIVLIGVFTVLLGLAYMLGGLWP
jgi:hypothetical protein